MGLDAQLSYYCSPDARSEDPLRPGPHRLLLSPGGYEDFALAEICWQVSSKVPLLADQCREVALLKEEHAQMVAQAQCFAPLLMRYLASLWQDLPWLA